MAAPWEKYKTQGDSAAGPWAKYGGATDSGDTDGKSAGMRGLEAIEPSAPTPAVKPPTLGERAIGAGEAALSIGSSAIQLPNIALSNIARAAGGPPDNAFARGAEAFTYQPRTEQGKETLRGIGGAADASKLSGLGPAEMFGHPGALMSGRAAVPPAVEAAKSVAASVLQMPGKAGKAISGAAEAFTGSQIPAARAEAQTAARGAVETGADVADVQASQEAMRVKAMGDVRSALEKRLEASKTTAPDLNTQGETIRGSFNAAIKSAKEARAAEADRLFSQAKEAAAAKEAQGLRVDTSAVETQLKAMLKQASGIPDLEAGISKMVSAVKGKPTVAPPVAPEIWVPEGVRPPTTPEPKGKTFEQLELTRRYLNDIGYSGDLEGYPAIVRRQAISAANAIDSAMQNFVPEFGEYKATYRAMSEPLESLGTRFGKALSGTEGGQQEAAYAKVANADLPNRLFARKDGVDLLVDALSGGKNAPAEARAAAAKQVDQMVEHWITENTRTKTPTAALSHIAAPGMQGTLSAVPEVAAKLKGRFGDLAALERTSSQMTKFIEEARGRGEKITDAVTKIKTDIQMADTLAEQPGAASQRQAFDAYVNAMARGRRANLIPQEKYKAALSLIDRATTLEEKTARARRIAKAIGVTGGALFLGTEAARIL